MGPRASSPANLYPNLNIERYLINDQLLYKVDECKYMMFFNLTTK